MYKNPEIQADIWKYNLYLFIFLTQFRLSSYFFCYFVQYNFSFIIYILALLFDFFDDNNLLNIFTFSCYSLTQIHQFLYPSRLNPKDIFFEANCTKEKNSNNFFCILDSYRTCVDVHPCPLFPCTVRSQNTHSKILTLFVFIKSDSLFVHFS